MIFACHKGFALTHNEFYWGQISSYLNTSLPPEIQDSGNYFAITMHFFRGRDLGSSLILWICCFQKLVTVLLKKLIKLFVPFMAKKLSFLDSSFHFHWIIISVKHCHASLAPPGLRRCHFPDTGFSTLCVLGTSWLEWAGDFKKQQRSLHYARGFMKT